MTDENPRRQRRLRYKGTHPRRFVERYKERDPERHAQELDKVRARGDTPAGRHRPICVQEVLEALDPRPGDVGLDATLGFGGHAQRRHPREREATRVAVLHGFDEVAEILGGMHYPFVSEEEQWLVDNRSRDGIHAQVTSPLGRWVRVGSLVAFREGDDAIWTAGLVRRLTREADDTRLVAVETLARGGAGVTVVPHLASKRKADSEGVVCVLLPGRNGMGDEVRLLLPPNTFSESPPFEMRAYERRSLLIPVTLLENCGDCQVGQYKILRPAD